MTNIKPLSKFIHDELPQYADEMGDPEEWYVLIGDMVTEYSIWADEEMPDDYEEVQEEMPPEDRDANPNVDGYYQIGTAGWLADAFDFGEEDDGFVSEAQWGDKIDKRLINILVVHGSVLSEEALEVANGEREPAEA